VSKDRLENRGWLIAQKIPASYDTQGIITVSASVRNVEIEWLICALGTNLGAESCYPLIEK
jgi:hypothetical protein